MFDAKWEITDDLQPGIVEGSIFVDVRDVPAVRVAGAFGVMSNQSFEGADATFYVLARHAKQWQEFYRFTDELRSSPRARYNGVWQSVASEYFDVSPVGGLPGAPLDNVVLGVIGRTADRCEQQVNKLADLPQPNWWLWFQQDGDASTLEEWKRQHLKPGVRAAFDCVLKDLDLPTVPKL